MPSKLNLSNLYFTAPVLPVSIVVHVSDTTSSLECVAAVVLLVAHVTPVNVVAVLHVYVNISELICIVPLELNDSVEFTFIVPEPVIPVEDKIFCVTVVDAELNIFVPLAASTKLLNSATIRTASLEDDVCGTI